LNELALLADALEHLIDLRPAAMYHHRIHPDQLEQYHVARKALLQYRIGHGVTAVFDDDGFIEKTLDVRQSL